MQVRYWWRQGFKGSMGFRLAARTAATVRAMTQRRFRGLILDFAGVLTSNMVEVIESFEEVVTEYPYFLPETLIGRFLWPLYNCSAWPMVNPRGKGEIRPVVRHID